MILAVTVNSYSIFAFQFQHSHLFAIENTAHLEDHEIFNTPERFRIISGVSQWTWNAFFLMFPNCDFSVVFHSLRFFFV